MADIHVSALNIYPIKSCAAISVDEIQMGPLGPVGDRQWMVVDEEGVFLTQRKHPWMAKINPRFDGEKLVVSIDGGQDLEVSTEECRHGSPMKVRVWQDEVVSRNCGDIASQWFSEIFEKPVHLVYMREDEPRLRQKDQPFKVGFADSRPLLLTNSKSLDEINSHLDSPVPMDRFRPNIVVDGSEAFEEDQWNQFTVGGVSVVDTVQCSRCVIPSIDQKAGLRKNDGLLATLNQFRKVDGQMMFGCRLIHEGVGSVRVGDLVRHIN